MVLCKVWCSTKFRAVLCPSPLRHGTLRHRSSAGSAHLSAPRFGLSDRGTIRIRVLFRRSVLKIVGSTVAPRRALRWHPRFRHCHPSSPDDGRDACSWRWGGFVGCARRGCCFVMRSVGCRRGGSRPAAVAADNYKGSSRGRAQAFGAWAWVRTMCRWSSRVRRGQL